jgi:hypothetical protein
MHAPNAHGRVHCNARATPSRSRIAAPCELNHARASITPPSRHLNVTIDRARTVLHLSDVATKSGAAQFGPATRVSARAHERLPARVAQLARGARAES